MSGVGWQRFAPGHQPPQMCANCRRVTERPRAAGWAFCRRPNGGVLVQCPACRTLEARYRERDRPRATGGTP
jgi:hypothetical protein